MNTTHTTPSFPRTLSVWKILGSLILGLALVLAGTGVGWAEGEASVTASADTSALVGSPAALTGTLSGFSGEVKVTPEVMIAGRWSSAASFTVSAESFTSAVTFGSQPGAYTWRVVATDGVRTAVSRTFTITRVTPPELLVSVGGPAAVGAPVAIHGWLEGFRGTVRVTPQVINGGGWSSAASFTTSADFFATSVTFGSQPGNYTWRLVATDGVRTAVSRTFTITRAASSSIDPRCLSGRALCISKAERKLRWVVGGQVRTTLDVRFGAVASPTRNGSFSVGWKSRNHVSSLYRSSMPFAMFFSGGQAVHYSSDFAARGYSGASHGCVNVRDYQAIKRLFDAVRVGDKVIVY